MEKSQLVYCGPEIISPLNRSLNSLHQQTIRRSEAQNKTSPTNSNSQINQPNHESQTSHRLIKEI